MSHHLGITGQAAPELVVDDWFARGEPAPPIRLADIDEPFVYPTPWSATSSNTRAGRPPSRTPRRRPHP